MYGCIVVDSAIISNLVKAKDFHKLKLYIELGFEISLTQQNGDCLEKFGSAENHAFDLVINNNINGIKRLRSKSLEVINDTGYTPLHWAIVAQRNDIFEYLLDFDFAMDQRTATGENYFTLASRYNNTLAFKRLLQKYGTKHLFNTNERGFNALIFAAAKKNKEIMQHCLQLASVYFVRDRNNYGANFLHWLFHGEAVPDNKKKILIHNVLKSFLIHFNKNAAAPVNTI